MTVRRPIVWKFAGLAVIGILVSFALLCRYESEPTYQGKTLSAWLEMMDSPRSQGVSSDVDIAWAAIRKMGSNAVPCLVKMMRCQDSALRTRIVAWASKQSLIKFKFRPPAERIQYRAVLGVWVLGPVATATVPDVVNMLTNRNTTTRVYAASALNRMGAEARAAVPALIAALDDPDPTVRCNVAGALGAIGLEARQAAPSLVRKLDDPDMIVRGCALNSIKHLGPLEDSAILELLPHLKNSNDGTRIELLDYVVSACTNSVILFEPLIERLADSNSFVRAKAAFHLGEFGSKSVAAVPALKILLEDPIIVVRQAAANALKDIAGITSEKPPREGADITLQLRQFPVSEALLLYEKFAKEKLVIAPNVPRDAIVNLETVQPLTTAEALEFFRDVLMEQARIAITRSSEGTLSAILKDPSSNIR